MSRLTFAPICSYLLAFALGVPSLACSGEVDDVTHGFAEEQDKIADEQNDATQGKTAPPVVIELSRRPSAGFCYAAGQYGTVALTRDAQATITMTGTVLEEAQPDDPACVTTYTGQSSCLAARPMVAQQLAAEDVSTLDALVAALPSDRCVVKELLACDSCQVGTITVDGVEHEKTCCGTQHSEGYDEAFLALEGFVDGLMP